MKPKTEFVRDVERGWKARCARSGVPHTLRAVRRLSCIALCAASVWSGSHAQATVFWDDEMESWNTGYTLPGNGGMSYDTSVKFSGSGSTRYNFGPECYPDASAQVNCGGFMDRTFTATNDLYKRFYMRLSSGFVVSDVFTKLMRTDGSNTSIPPSDWWTIRSNGSKDFVAILQGVAAGGRYDQRLYLVHLCRRHLVLRRNAGGQQYARGIQWDRTGLGGWRGGAESRERQIPTDRAEQSDE